MANCLPQSLAASKGRTLICEGTAFQSPSGANNPKGIVASSPRLRGTSYLGKTSKQKDNRNAVAAMARGSCSIELFRHAAEIRVERVARDFVAQERPAVFGGEDQMNVNGGTGLWHDGKMVNRGNGARLCPQDQSQQVR